METAIGTNNVCVCSLSLANGWHHKRQERWKCLVLFRYKNYKPVLFLLWVSFIGSKWPMNWPRYNSATILIFLVLLFIISGFLAILQWTCWSLLDVFPSVFYLLLSLLWIGRKNTLHTHVHFIQFRLIGISKSSLNISHLLTGKHSAIFCLQLSIAQKKNTLIVLFSRCLWNPWYDRQDLLNKFTKTCIPSIMTYTDM